MLENAYDLVKGNGEYDYKYGEYDYKYKEEFLYDKLLSYESFCKVLLLHS